MKTILHLALLLALPRLLAAQGPDKSLRTKPEEIDHSSGTPRWQVLSINNLWTWHRSDGEGNHSPGGVDGVFFPKFTGHCVYEDNVVLGGKVFVGGFPESGGVLSPDQPIRINGGTYLSNHGMDEGWVDGFGAQASPVDKNHPEARIYRIRRDYRQMDLSELTQEAQIYYEHSWGGDVTDAQRQAIIDQYAYDWEKWPVQHGAPYIERNGLPGYQAPPPFSESFTANDLVIGNHDEPGVAGADPANVADQVLFTVYNGLRAPRTMNFAGSRPLGVEIQKTVWAYRVNTSLGSHYFTHYRIINKGGVDIGGGTLGAFHIDSLYFSQWSDIDIGRAGDDVVGCDSVLALGFGYNSQPVDNNYAGYNLPPPSAGYILLAGPAVDGSVGDSAIVDFERVYEKRNLPMSSFAYLSTGTAGSTDPQFIDYDLGSGQWWKLLRGYRPLGTFDSADVSYPTPLGLPATRFPLSGDPTSQSGFIDGQGTSYSLAPYDRRVLVNSGPVRLAPGDTAGVIMGFAVGMGSDFLSSVSAMKAMVRVAHEATQELFAHPRGPLRPRVTAIELNKEIVLSWGDDQELVDAIEYMDAPGGYAFEGYVVYQLPWESAPLSEGIKLATFDVMNGVTVIRNNVFPLNQEIVQEGTDSGIYRSLRVRADELENTRILYNGRKYYFAVTAYNYTPDETREIRSYESEPARIQAIPQIPFGILPPTSSGDSLAIERLSGNSTGTISAVVVDPTRPGGDTYELRFDTAAGRTTMEVWNSSRSILAGSSDLAGMPYVASLTADGVEVQARHVDEFLRFEVTANGAGLLDPPEQGCFAFNSNGFPFLDGADRPTERQQVGTGYWGIHTGMTGANDGTFSSFTVQVTENGSLWPVISPGDYEIRFTASGGVGFAPSAYTTGGDTGGVVLNVPFELWNIGSGMSNDPSDDVRLFPYLLDIMGDGIFNLAPIDHVVSGASNDPETDWFFWVVPADQSPGQSGYEEIAAEVMTNGVNHVYLGPLTAGTEVLRRMVLVNWNGGDVQDPSFPLNVAQGMPETGTVLRITTGKPFGPVDLFQFAVPAAGTGPDAIKASADRVGVYPNPFMAGWNYADESSNEYVTFNNLPENVNIRIFDLAGRLIRILQKTNSSQFHIWDLRNTSNQPVASGIYVCYVEMPEIGHVKILKLAVIQPVH